MDKKGESQKKTDIFGNEYTEHTDKQGNATGESREREDIFGEEYTEHRDKYGNKSGESRERKDIFGEEYTEHRDKYGNKTGESRKKSGLFGDEYVEHIDKYGNKVGESRERTDIFGNEYVENTGKSPNYFSVSKQKSRTKNTQREDESINIAVKIGVGVAIFVGILWLIGVILRFIFNAVIPIIVMNTAIISLIGIYALGFVKEKKGLLHFLPILGGLYIVLDVNLGWTTEILKNYSDTFSVLIPYFFYINLAAGLTALYLFVAGIMGNIRLLEKRSIILIGVLTLTLAITIFITNDYHRNLNLFNSSVANISNNDMLDIELEPILSEDTPENMSGCGGAYTYKDKYNNEDHSKNEYVFEFIMGMPAIQGMPATPGMAIIKIDGQVIQMIEQEDSDANTVVYKGEGYTIKVAIQSSSQSGYETSTETGILEIEKGGKKKTIPIMGESGC